jgi:hypothetical protein
VALIDLVVKGTHSGCLRARRCPQTAAFLLHKLAVSVQLALLQAGTGENACDQLPLYCLCSPLAAGVVPPASFQDDCCKVVPMLSSDLTAL